MVFTTFDTGRITGNALVQDYLQQGSASSALFSHACYDASSAYEARKAHAVPRAALVEQLNTLHTGLQASDATKANINRLSDNNTMTVITGQQVGLAGGPLYTYYKIISTIKWARKLEQDLGCPVVPVYWLATEDHDFFEVNFQYALKKDTIVKESYSAEDWGGPIGDIKQSSVDDAWQHLAAHLDLDDESMALLAPNDETYTWQWHANIWLRLFTEEGLVVVTPQTLWPLANDFFDAARNSESAIQQGLESSRDTLDSFGLQPALLPSSAGRLFTFDGDGNRVRLKDHPEGSVFSTDAALRPVLADALLPNIAQILGPGEITYQAQLKPIYEHFKVPQTGLFPRESWTLVPDTMVSQLERYDLTPEQALANADNAHTWARAFVSEETTASLAHAEDNIKQLTAMLGTLANNDVTSKSHASMTKDIERALARYKRKLQGQARHAAGIGPSEATHIAQWLKPKGQPQERFYGLPAMLSIIGHHAKDTLMSADTLQNPNHQLLIVPSRGGN